MAAQNKYFIFSLITHGVVFLVLILSFSFSTPLPVLENTNKQDVISAVVLGDTEKSKIVPQQFAPPAPVIKQINKPEEAQKKTVRQAIQKEVIALKIAEKKRQQDLFAKALLADIKKQRDKQKKIKQAQLKKQFEKTLREQAEKTMRQQLLNEEIKLQGTKSRQAQGEINKYKALILQAISEHWIIPSQSNKRLYSQLLIRLAPGGVVLDVQITKSSGDPALDSSARAAVIKSSPLPVPTDPAQFESFREFALKVKPENIMDD